MITPLSNSIIFTFVEKVNINGMFERENTESGIILNTTVDDSATKPRWAIVDAVGPACKTVKVGQQILIPNLMWTNGFKYGNDKCGWKTDESKVVVVRNSKESDIVALNNYVIFLPTQKSNVTTTSSNLVVVRANDDTPTGTVVAVGDKADSYVEVDSQIYYNAGAACYDFEHLGKTYHFVESDSIIAVV